jgi:uncharacterized protein YuzE
MKIHYDRKTDSLYIQLSEAKNIESEEIAPGFVLDFGNSNRIVGIDIEHASTIIYLDKLEANIPFAKKASV